MRNILILLGVVAMNLTAAIAVACDTPVYRYAMYKWQPRPYELYYFHNGPKEADAAKSFHDEIEDQANDQERPANIFLATIDLSEDKALDKLPRDVQKRWTEREDQSTPQYLLVSPDGAEVYFGDLTLDDFTAMTMSAACASAAQQLASGKTGLLMLLTCEDEAANQRAEGEVKKLLKSIADGEVSLYISPTQNAPGILNKKEVEKPKHEVGYVKVAANDPKEKWLVRMLMSIEDDLYDFTKEPMVFGVYGRVRALPPYIGKGIVSESLLDCVDFMTGACSCTVRDQNPGVDLMLRYDWETAAAQLAEKFGGEEGNEGLFFGDQIFPELALHTATSEPATKDDDIPDSSAEGTDNVVAGTDSPVANDDAQPENAASQDAVNGDDNSPADGLPDDVEVSAANSSTTTAMTKDRAATVADEVGSQSLFYVGTALVAGVALLLAVTFVILRPRY